MKKLCQEKIKFNREQNTRNMTCRHVSNIDAWVLFGNAYVPSSVTEYHLCTISCVKIESLELSWSRFFYPPVLPLFFSFFVKSKPQTGLREVFEEWLGVPCRKIPRLSCHTQVVHCTFTLPCIIHVYPQQEKRGIQHVCLGSHAAKGRKLRPRISKGAEKNTCGFLYNLQLFTCLPCRAKLLNNLKNELRLVEFFEIQISFFFSFLNI